LPEVKDCLTIKVTEVTGFLARQEVEL